MYIYLLDGNASKGVVVFPDFSAHRRFYQVSISFIDVDIDIDIYIYIYICIYMYIDRYMCILDVHASKGVVVFPDFGAHRRFYQVSISFIDVDIDIYI